VLADLVRQELEHVAFPLVISLGVKVINELG
jgi:hypothetical protein